VAMMIEMVTAKVFSLALNHLSKDILSNWEVIAVNQGSVDVQGKKVQSNNGLEARIYQPLQSALVPPMKHLVLQQNHK